MPKMAMPKRRKGGRSEESAVASLTVTGRDRILEIRLKRENNEWLDEHRLELRKKYPDRYVAVFGRKVVAQSKEFHTVISELRKESESAPAIAAIEFMNKDEVVWVI